MRCGEILFPNVSIAPRSWSSESSESTGPVDKIYCASQESWSGPEGVYEGC